MDYKAQIEELLNKFTLQEKIDMIHGCGLFRTKGVERLGIPGVVTSDGPMGVRMQFPDDSWIPVGKSDDFVTYNPSNSALAATWNPKLAYESGKALGEEARGRGKDVILAPGVNIKRDPLCGRNFEYFSEDPYLIETLAVPFIKGVQENDVAACVKHFAVNNQETDRMAIDTYVDERTLREIYLPAFRAAVKDGDSYSVMNAYNKFRGHFCSESKELLDDILRDEWKYDGTVISDWGSTHSTEGVAEHSMDMEMSVTADFDEYFLANPLLEAVKKGEVDEECVNAKVRNILRLMFRLKMLGEDALTRKTGAYDTPGHRRQTYETAKESVVLLKNDGRTLPITQDRIAMQPVRDKTGKVISARKCRIAVIGHNASHCHAGGGGSAEIKALYEVSPLLGLKKALGGNVEVTYAQGYYIPGKKSVNEVNWQEASLERRVMGQEDPDSEEQKKLRKEIEENRAMLLKEACETAKGADIVIFVGGLNHDYDTEGRDRTDMKLPYGQDELIERLLEVNPDMIVVMHAGSPVEMPWRERAKAILWCYFSGMETGSALADVLLGRVNPSGKLPETFPVRYEDTVTYRNGEFGNEGRVEYKEGIFVGYRYYEKEAVKPAFPFGYGLSYTDFRIDEPELVKETPFADSEVLGDDELSYVKSDGNKSDANVVLSVRVSNTGSVPGAEVVQCYVSDTECRVERPVKELKAYEKVFLEPGESCRITFALPRRAFAFYDVERKGFVTEHGEFKIIVGNSSADQALCTTVVL